MNNCNCDICKNACKSYPGKFVPGQIEKAAYFMGMDIEDFMSEYIALDVYEIDNTVIKFLMPKYIRNGFKCIFLQENGCKLPIDIRPLECAKYYGCSLKKMSMDEVAALWKDQTEVEYFFLIQE